MPNTEQNNNNDNMWGAAAINAGASVANSLINQAFAEHNRKRNFHYNEMAANNADKRQRAQYFDLYSPQALMSQYAAAGLSPSMMMSGGQSAVGQSSAQGNQSAGIQGAYPTAQVFDPLTAAQIANINADTKKKEAEKENISEDTIGQKIDNYINQTTLPQSIEQATQEVESLKAEIAKVKSETQGIDWKNAFNLITEDAQIEQLMNKNAELCARVEELEARANLHDSNATLNNTERQKMMAEIVKMQKDVAQRYIELDIYNDSVHGQNRWFEEQAFQGMKNIELRTDMFNFEKGEKWEFEKFKVGKQIQLAGWKIGLDFGASMLQTAVDAIGIKSAANMKQLEIDTKKELETRSKTKTIDYYDSKGRHKGHRYESYF